MDIPELLSNIETYRLYLGEDQNYNRFGCFLKV